MPIYGLPEWYIREKLVFALHYPHDVVDNAGRPLMEWASLLGIETKRVKCPFSDSRKDIDHLINISTMQLMNNQKEDINFLLEKFIYEASDVILHLPTHLKIWYISMCFMSNLNKDMLRSFVRQENYLANAVEASLYKLSRGFIATIEIWMERYRDEEPDAFLNGENLYKFCDSHGLLIGRKEACAASPQVIIKFLSFFIDKLSVTESVESDVRSNLFDRDFLFAWAFGKFAFTLYDVIRISSNIENLKKERKNILNEQNHYVTFRRNYTPILGLDQINQENVYSKVKVIKELLLSVSSYDAGHEKLSLKFLSEFLEIYTSEENYNTGVKKFNAVAVNVFNEVNSIIYQSLEFDCPNKLYIDEKDMNIFFGKSLVTC